MNPEFQMRIVPPLAAWRCARHCREGIGSHADRHWPDCTDLPEAAKRLEMAAVSPSVSRELILASPIAHPPSIATTTIATLIVSEIQELSRQGRWKINMTA
jgi:hypothetical protein